MDTMCYLVTIINSRVRVVVKYMLHFVVIVNSIVLQINVAFSVRLRLVRKLGSAIHECLKTL